MTTPARCPSGKKRYPTEQAAQVSLTSAKISRALHGQGNRREQRAYACVTCRGWHLTSEPLDNARAGKKPGVPRMTTVEKHGPGWHALVAWSSRIHGEMDRGRPSDRHEWAIECADLLEQHGPEVDLPPFPSRFPSTRESRDETIRRLFREAS